MTSIGRRGMMVLSLAGTVLVVACSSPNPRLYTLAPVPGTPEGGAPKVVLMHQITVARYLERPEIVRSSENYRLDVMANDTWGEPLGAMVARVLAEDLTQRLPGTTVIGADSAIAVNEDASVSVNIRRMDKDTANNLVLAAQASVTFHDPGRKGAMRSLNTTVPVATASIAEEVQAMSIALGRLADEIAAMLREPNRPSQPAHPVRHRQR